MKTGVQGIYKLLKILDSGFRRNDGKGHFQTFYEAIKFGAQAPVCPKPPPLRVVSSSSSAHSKAARQTGAMTN